MVAANRQKVRFMTCSIQMLFFAAGNLLPLAELGNCEAREL